MNNVNIILAAGDQVRWNQKKYLGVPKVKQLVQVKDEILIERIQRQFSGAIVVTKNEDIRKHSFKWYDPEHCPVTIITLFSTRHIWKYWTTILLGDVDYGEHTIKKIKTQKAKMMFYGTEKEIFALKFRQEYQLTVVQGIHAVMMSKDFKPKFGKLWNLYRMLNMVDFRVHHIGKYFTFVNDCRDFDTQKYYIDYVQRKTIHG